MGERRLVVTLDARREVTTEHVRCATSDAEECRTSDDPADDADPGTSLRFTFAPAFPVTVDTP